MTSKNEDQNSSTDSSDTTSPGRGERVGDGFARGRGIGGAAYVAGAAGFVDQGGFDGFQDGGAGFDFAEVIEHHGSGPDLGDGICDAFSGDVRGGAVDGFEERRKAAFGIDVAGGCDADGSGAGGAEVGEDVAEEIGGDDDVEAVGVEHEVGSEDVDVVLVPGYRGEGFADRLDALVPEGHGDGDAIGFGGGGEVFFLAALRERECEVEDAVDADAGHHGLLHNDFAVGSGEDSAADGGQLAFGILDRKSTRLN